MEQKISFSSLLTDLNQISDFKNPKFQLEQYQTPNDSLKHYFNLFPSSNADIILDLGIGTGKLSFLASKLGATNVIGIDSDRDALQSINQDLFAKLTLICSAIEFFPFNRFSNKIDGVIMNPPFGTKRKYVDLLFLKKALSLGGWVLSLHKNNVKSNKKLQQICKDNQYQISNEVNFALDLPNSYEFHEKLVHKVDVILYYLTPKF